MPETKVEKKEPVSLASLMTPSKTVTIDFPGFAEMTVDLCYLAREELVRLRKKCLSTKWNKKTRQPEEELNEDELNEDELNEENNSEVDNNKFNIILTIGNNKDDYEYEDEIANSF